MKISRVLVTGASGQLAASVVRAFADREVIAHTRAALDVTDGDAVQREIGKARPDLIVNCAAFNQVDAAEHRPTEAFAVNAFAVRSLARAAEACGAVFVHYGSDFVFDGTATEPYDETATPGPRSVYASSKLLGEWFAADCPRHYVLRVESLFGRAPNGPPSKGSAAGILKTMLEGGEPTVFEDRTVSPTYLLDAARAPTPARSVAGPAAADRKTPCSQAQPAGSARGRYQPGWAPHRSSGTPRRPRARS